MSIPTHITLNWKPRLRSLRSIWFVILSKPTWLLGITIEGADACCGDIGAAILLYAIGGVLDIERKGRQFYL